MSLGSVRVFVDFLEPAELSLPWTTTISIAFDLVSVRAPAICRLRAFVFCCVCLCAWLRDRVSVSLTHWVGQLQHRTGGRERFDENVLDFLFFKTHPKVQEAVMKYALHPGRHESRCPVVSLVL